MTSPPKVKSNNVSLTAEETKTPMKAAPASITTQQSPNTPAGLKTDVKGPSSP